MRYAAEISNRFIGQRSCDELLYAPIRQSVSFRESRRYDINFSGDEEALRCFAEKVLLDPVSESIHIGENPALSGFCFFLDISLKPVLLNLEKEYLLDYYKGLPNQLFKIIDLFNTRRIYFFTRGDEVLPDAFVKDIVNPVIHTWTVNHAPKCA